MKHYDLIIAGGGISGLYSAYRLKKANPARNIALFEALPDFGGRIQTGSFANGLFLPAYGALRIEPDYQMETNRFIHELKIPVKPIEQGEASSAITPDLEKLTQEERNLILDNPEKPADLLLMELALQTILGNQWDVYADTLDNPERQYQLAHLRKVAVYKGKPLHQQGVWNVFNDVLSYEAIEFFREQGAYYNMKNDNHNAIYWIAFLLDLRLMKQHSYIPVGGMIQAIHHIATEVKALGVECYLNHQLNEIREQDEVTTHLSFSKNPSGLSEEFTAEHVILAIPQYPLKKLAANFPPDINTLIDSIIPIPLLWVTATMKNPPWGPDTKPTSGEGVPVRNAHFEYKMHQGEPYGMAMFYCDPPWYHYWSAFVENQEEDFAGYQAVAQVNKNPRLKEELEKTIQHHLNLPDRPSIDEWGIRDWGRPPFGAAVHFWKIGAQADQIMGTFKAFSLSENSLHKNIHICGEAFSEYQGFIEGAIRTANYAVAEIQQFWG